MNIESIIKNFEAHYLPLTDECKTELLQVSKILTGDKNEKLVKEGQFADRAYFIISGAARAFYLKDGKEITDWFAFENDFICSIHSFFLNSPSLYSIELMDAGLLLEISREKVQLLSSKYREFDRLEKQIITKTMIQLQQRVVSIQFETAKQKYDTLLKTYPHITQRVALTHIASYLGITLETLSRIRSNKKRI